MLDIGTLSQESVGLPTPLLDLYPGAVGAYSFRKLSSSYTGAAIRVQDINTGNEIDIGFNSANGLDISALIAFTGTASSSIVTIYDQSGNGFDLTIDIVNPYAYPLIAKYNPFTSELRIFKANNKPCISVIPSAYKYVNPTMTLDLHSCSVYASGRTWVYSSVAGFNGVVGSYNNPIAGDNDYKVFNLFADNKYYFGDQSIFASITSTIAPAQPDNYSFIVSSTARGTSDREMFTNGTSSGINNTFFPAGTFRPCVFSKYNPFYSTEAWTDVGINEIIMYPVGHNSATAIGIHTNMNQYANVY